MSVTTDAERLAARELSRVFQVVLRIRIFVAPTVAALGLLVFYYDRAWRELLCSGIAGVVFVIALFELQELKQRWMSPLRILGVLVSILCVHFALVVVTGGIMSPFVIALPLSAFVAPIAVGRRRLILVFVAAIVLGCWTLAVAAWTAPGFEPALLARGPAPPALILLLALVLTVAPIGAAASGIWLRRAFDHAVLSAAESNRELVRSMRERNDELLALGGALAHELKNPLAAIRGLAALQARKQEPGSKSAEQMAVLLDEVGRMSSILDELSSFSQPAQKLTVEPVDPTAIVEQIVSIHEPLAAERGVSLTAVVNGAGPLRCDPRKLKQILVNLLQNAIDASEHGGEVRARVTRDGEVHVFRIEDRGSGLADAVRGRLFTPGATTKIAGSGLGLTIANAIAKQHGGALTLSEREGGGCVAELRLPTQPAPSDDGGKS